MVGTLTLSSAASPFPFAAAAIATYTGNAELNFDESVSAPTLELDGTTVTSEDEIVRALAKEGGLSDDSAKVCLISVDGVVVGVLADRVRIDTSVLCARKVAPDSDRVPGDRGCA